VALTVSPNGIVFDLPEIVALEEGIFDRAGLDVVRLSSGNQWTQSPDLPVLERLKESLYEQGAADVYNLCEWGSIDRAERTGRGARIAYLRPAVVAQAIVSFDDALQEPHDLAGVAVGVNEYTGSHYITLHLLEGTLRQDQIVVRHVGGRRLERLRDGDVRAVALMEPYISLALKQGAHIIATYYYRGAEIIAPDLEDEARSRFVAALNEAVDLINADPRRYVGKLLEPIAGELSLEGLSSHYFRYVHATPFPEQRFGESYEWMRTWGLTDGANDYRGLVAAGGAAR
jgi:NitT/TauT family transport system substrate-binding protein